MSKYRRSAGRLGTRAAASSLLVRASRRALGSSRWSWRISCVRAAARSRPLPLVRPAMPRKLLARRPGAQDLAAREERQLMGVAQLVLMLKLLRYGWLVRSLETRTNCSCRYLNCGTGPGAACKLAGEDVQGPY